MAGNQEKPDSRGTVSEFFPFVVGARWTYTYRETLTGGPDAPEHTTRGRYSETVVSVDNAFGNAITVVGISRDGSLLVSSSCSESSFWYVVSKYQIFIECDHGEAIKLATKLHDSPSGQVNEPPEYALPFRLGTVWGLDSDTPKRSDTMYQWYVEGAGVRVTVPAGTFKGCFDMIYRTLPDHEIRWVCPGVGLVASEYEHHGTTDRYRVELESYKPGGTRASR
jgi:hypothetical protein